MNSLSETLRLARQGDVEAVGQIIERYSGTIEQECAKFGIWDLPEWSHSDLCQQVIFRVLTKLDQFKGFDSGDPDPVFNSWIRTSARNAIKNIIRNRTSPKRAPEKPIQAFDEITQTYFANQTRKGTASSILMRDEETERIQKIILENLDEHGKVIINLRIVEGLSLKEISERLPLTYEQVRYKFDKSLAVLKQKLGDTI